MTKGAGMQCGAAGIGAREVLCQVQVDTHRWPGQPTLPLVVCLPAEEHRALVRRQLLTVLGAGLSPLDMFANDLKARRDSLKFFLISSSLYAVSSDKHAVQSLTLSCFLPATALSFCFSQSYFFTAECFAQIDLSFMVKTGVQYSLWGGSVLNLGTEGHRRRYFDDIAAFRLPGCFAMTELKHGEW